MTVNTTDFYNWQASTKVDAVRFNKASPNLLAVMDHLIKRFAGTNIGIFVKRPIRGGDVPSSHSFGSALDWRYPSRRVGLLAIDDLIANSKEYGVQAIHDYVGCRIWRSCRNNGKGGWQKQKPDKYGMGQAWSAWLHVETTKTDWANKVPVVDRH